MAFTHTTSTAAYPWRPDVSTFAAEDVIGDALVVTCSTKAGEVAGDQPAVRVALISDDTATFVKEGAEIGEAAPELNEVVIKTACVAQLIRVTRSQFRQAGTSERLATSAARAIVKAADVAFLSQPAPTAPAEWPPAGILATPGIIGGGQVDASLDTIVDLVAQIEANGGTADRILVHPTTWGALRKLKVADSSNQSLVGAGTEDATPALLGVPVVRSIAVPEGTGVVLDRGAVASAWGPVTVQTDESVYFTSSAVAVKAEFRFGAALTHPGRVGTFTVGTTVAKAATK